MSSITAAHAKPTRHRISVPQWLAASLVQAHQSGARDAMNPVVRVLARSQSFADWAVGNFPKRPAASVLSTAAELRIMHRIAAARTAEQTRTARWFAHDGDKGVWERELAAWQATVTPAQAAWGAALLAEARTLNAAINQRAKQRFGRTRPYAEDRSLTTAVPRSNATSPSYPSGHSARAFLEATIMSALNPARRGAYMAIAQQMAMSRVYGGVHYPTDVVAGAWEGGAVATWLLDHRPMPVE